MQKPREQMQGQFLMGVVKKKKTKGTKGVEIINLIVKYLKINDLGIQVAFELQA